MPFVAVASDFSAIKTNEYYRYVYEFFGFSKEYRFVVAFGLILVFFYIFRSGLNLYYFHILARFSQGRYHLLAHRLFGKYLGLSYKDFVQKNSSALTKTIVNEANHLTMIFQAFLFMISEIFVVIFIYAMMFYVNWKITLVLTVALGLNGLFLIKTVSTRIKKAGSDRERVQKSFYEIINRSFGNFKLIKLMANDQKILYEFSASSFAYANSNIRHISLSHFPRLFLEAIGFGILVLIVTYLVFKYESDIASAMGLLSMFVLGLYRLMPSANRILSGYNEIMFYHKSLDIVHDDLMYDVEKLGDEKIELQSGIKLQNISFEYEKNKPILKDINLEIKRGEKIAFVGESGGGKTTLVDIIIGLYKPKHGTIYIDKKLLSEKNIKQWRQKIGYIPQNVYLFDGSVKENVAFGAEFDKKRVVEVLKQAKIYDFLQTKKGIDTVVGEGGIMLSGGQKQRIAIARALYKNPDILVLDEATSALDSKVEEEIMNEIYDISKDKTLLVIAHRLSTIQKCERVYTIKHGVLYK